MSDWIGIEPSPLKEVTSNVHHTPNRVEVFIDLGNLPGLRHREIVLQPQMKRSFSDKK